MAAVRTAIVPEMADVGGCVVVRRAAAKAVLRVGGVLQRRAGVRRVVDAEAEGVAALAAEIADLRVVCVDHEQRVGESGHRVAPAGGDELQLAVAVELVAEEVPEQKRLRPAAVARPRAALPRRPRRGRVRRRPRRAASTRRPRRGSRPSGCGRAVRSARAARRPSRSSSSCRSSPRRAPSPAEAVAASRSMPSGSSFQRSLPGSVVPPPRPARRESAPVARSAAGRALGFGGASSGRRRTSAGALRAGYLRAGQGALPFLSVARKRNPPVERDRSAGSGRVPGGYPPALHRRADPRPSCGRRRPGSGARRR